MNEQAEYWTCPRCRAQQDIGQLGFYAEVVCPRCGGVSHVHSMLSNYKVEAVLGIGGMSVVFKARDLILGRPLAIKVLNDTYRDAPERIAGFENECSFMAKVRHENVVSIYSAGWARGQFYIAMELVEGRNLELIVAAEGRLAPLQAIEIIRQVALGLQAANEAGILHRDVKPGNVLITDDGHAKVLDFGLSLDEKDGVDDDEIIWATPYYVPPETLRREDETVRTDIYALGMTLRNLLTGEATLPGNPQNVAEMLVAKKTLPLMQDTAPELDASLCKLVDALAAYEPADRPANYAEVLRRVNKVQKRLMDEADPTARLRRRLRRVYAVAGAAASMAAGLAGAFVVAMNTPSGTIQESVEVGALRWSEPELYHEAELLLQAGEMARASEVLGRFTSENMEPAVVAAAMVLRTAVDVLEDKSTANGYRRFAEWASQVGPVSESGRSSFDYLVELVSALQTDSGKAEKLAEAVEAPLLRAAALILVADSYVHAGNPAEGERVVALVHESVSGMDTEALRPHLEEYAQAVPRRAARVLHAQVKDMFRAGNYAEASEKVEELQTMKLSRLEKEELMVMHEASVIMQAILDMMEQKRRRARAGMSPEEMRTAATGLGGNIPREFSCVAMILAGDFEAAFRENPYAAEETSRVPFAVIMRDWQGRLGR